MLLRKQHLAFQSGVVFIKRQYGALYAAKKGHGSFPACGRSPLPDRLVASGRMDISFVGAGSCEGGGLNRI